MTVWRYTDCREGDDGDMGGDMGGDDMGDMGGDF